MKTYARVLFCLALVATVCVGASWVRCYRGSRFAAREAARFESERDGYAFAARLDDANASMAIETDEKRIEGDDLDAQIASAQGRSAAAAHAREALDRARLNNDEEVQRLREEMQALGGDPQVTAAQERVEAAHASQSVYGAALVRDERLMWGAAGIWLAFGFAAAFAGQQRAARLASA